MPYFLPALLSLASSATAAIDIGSFFTKASTFNSTLSPKIAENTESKRLTPSFVAFRIKKGMNTSTNTLLKPSEVEEAIPAIGNKALSLMERRPFMGTGYFALFCDLKDDVAQNYSEKYITNSSITRFSYEDSLALFVQLYVNSIMPGTDSKHVSFVVPATWTIRQRKIFENAVRNAKYHFSGIIDDNEAVFTYFAVERIRFFNNKPQTVLFVDVGAASIKAYAARFELVKDKKSPTAHVNVTKLSYSISNNEGGSLITSRMAKHFINKLGLKNLKNSEKRRIFYACEKMKLALSLPSVRESQQFVEDIGDSDEIFLKMKEEELLEFAQPLIDEVVAVAKDALGDIPVDDVQLIGGGTRTLGLSNVLQEKLNLTVRSNLNQEETIAIGGGYAAQYKTGSSRLSSIQWNETYPPLSISIQDGSVKQSVCTRGENCKSTISLANAKDTISLEYEPTELPLPLKHTVISYNTSVSTLPLILQFSHSPTQIAYASRCNETNCTTAYMIPTIYDFAGSAAFSTILKMEAKRKNVAQARYQLEFFTQHILDDVDHNQTFRYFMSDSQRFTIHKAADKMHKWLLENANSIQNETLFKTFYNELSAYVNPVLQRMHENRTLATAEGIIHKTLQYAMMASYVEWPANRTWINQSTLDGFHQLLNETMQFLDLLSEAKKSTPPWESLSITAHNVTEVSLKLYKEMLRIEAILPTYKPRSTKSFFTKVKEFFGFGKKANSTESKPVAASKNTKKKPPASSQTKKNEKSSMPASSEKVASSPSTGSPPPPKATQNVTPAPKPQTDL